MDLAREWRGDREPHTPVLGVIEPTELRRRSWYGAIRGSAVRVADLVGACLLLALASPLLAAGAALVFVTSGRPVLFAHVRVGRWGRPFRCWKLRTMRSDAEKLLVVDAELRRRYVVNGFKLPSDQDPWVLRGGAWLRRLYVDELPQLWNVIRGDMSLVGPRPVVARELALFGDDITALLERRPGVFGEWTSRGRRRPPYPERVHVEMEYVNDPSLRRSVRILVRSVGAVVRGQGAEG